MAQRDYDINDCYNHFISKAEDDKIAYKNELSESEKNVDYLYSLLIGWQDVIKSKFDIDLCDCTEVRNKTYNENEDLYNKAVRLAKIFEDEESIKLLNTLIKYCHVIKNVHLCKKAIDNCDRRKNVPFATYKNLLKKYYRNVNAKALSGKGVRFSNGLGIFVVNYEKTDNWSGRKTIDFQATARAKKELLEKGLKPYDKKEAEEYKRAGITYNGIECTIYKDARYRLSVDMIAPTAFRGGMLKIVPVNTIPANLRGISYQEFAERFSEEELNNRNIYILTRAEVNLKRNPLNYLRYTHKMNL